MGLIIVYGIVIGGLLLVAHILCSAVGAKKAVPAMIKAVGSGLGVILGAVLGACGRMLGVGLRNAGRGIKRGFRSED